MIKKIYFYNAFHMGDVFYGKEFINHVMFELKDNFEIYYLHNYDSKITNSRVKSLRINNFYEKNKNLDFLLEDSNLRFNKYFIVEDSLFLNTWWCVGSYNYNVHEFTYKNLKKYVWEYIFEILNKELGLNIKMFDDWHYVPTINKNLIDSTIPELNNKPRVLFSNGPVRSHQCHLGDLQVIIVPLVDHYKEIDFICTEPIDYQADNLFFTNDILNREKLKENIVEIANFSTTCDIIVGKNSSPASFCTIKENYLNENKTIIDCTWTGNNMWAGLEEVKAECIRYSDFTEFNLLPMIQERIEKLVK